MTIHINIISDLLTTLANIIIQGKSRNKENYGAITQLLKLSQTPNQFHIKPGHNCIIQLQIMDDSNM